MYTKAEMSEREFIVKMLINSVRIWKDLPEVEGDKLIKMAREWLKVLRSIPTKSLETAFIMAMENHRGGNFGVDNVVTSWAENSRNRTAQENSQEQKAQGYVACPKCYGTGMEVVKGRGARRCDCKCIAVNNFTKDESVDLSAEARKALNILKQGQEKKKTFSHKSDFTLISGVFVSNEEREESYLPENFRQKAS